MTIPQVNCTNCGKNLTTDDLRRVDCRYCGTVLPHHARAQQQVAVINQMMADHNRNGIPDAFEPLVHNAQANAMNQAFGGPYVGPPGAPPPMVYPAAAHHQAQAAAKVATGAAAAGLIVTLAVLLFFLLAVGAGVAFFALSR